MGYVIYEVESTKLLTRREFKTEAAAKAGRTRALNKIHAESGAVVENTDYAIAEADVFYASIEKRVAVENMMSGKIVYEGVNTPNFMSVGSEAYWSA